IPERVVLPEGADQLHHKSISHIRLFVEYCVDVDAVRHCAAKRHAPITLALIVYPAKPDTLLWTDIPTRAQDTLTRRAEAEGALEAVAQRCCRRWFPPEGGREVRVATTAQVSPRITESIAAAAASGVEEERCGEEPVLVHCIRPVTRFLET